MVEYDRSVIQKFAERLYAQARQVLVVGSLFGLIVGAGAAVAITRGRGPGTAEVLIGAAIGLALGFALAQGRAFSLRLQAQVALCQAAIEKNTRPARPEAPPLN